MSLGVRGNPWLLGPLLAGASRAGPHRYDDLDEEIAKIKKDVQTYKAGSALQEIDTSGATGHTPSQRHA